MKKPFRSRVGLSGYVSYIMVLSAGGLLTMMTLSAYKHASVSQKVQAETQLRVDYAEKEDAVLRAIVNLVPNRAIRVMQKDSDSTGNRQPLRWQTILSDALNQANARTSISSTVKSSVGGTGAIVANAGDGAYTDIGTVFDPIEFDGSTGDVSSGLNRSLGTGFPVPLQTSNSTLGDRDKLYPVISNLKQYGNLATGGVSLPVTSYPKWNIIPYPQIRFGYCEPGQPFVAKRNWWAFSMHLGESQGLLASYGRGDSQIGERDFIVSIYEIPSQLAISAEAFTKIGTHADGTAWKHATIEGGVFATRAQVDSGMHVDRLMARRGLQIGGDVSIGNTQIDGNPLLPGVREKFEVSTGTYMPVAVASESGRATFVPINRGPDFFDRFAHSSDPETPESNTLSATTWNQYSVGALQCAMTLDISGVASATDRTPTALRFKYFKGGTRRTLDIPLNAGVAPGLPQGYLKVANEGQSYNFGSQLVDVAYGADSSYFYKTGVTGTISFNNATFGDPLVGTNKAGYARPTFPFEIKYLNARPAIAIYPERFPAFLSFLGADSTAENHSLAVNVNYTTSGFNMSAYKPSIPCTDNDYAVLMTECDDLTAFTKGFSLVTNLRLYIGDDFNVVATTPPTGSGLPSPFYPPASLFAPEKRYGTDFDPFKVEVAGQIGHLGGDDRTGENPVHLLDFKMASEANADAANIDVNLRPITHPAELPPVTMMNWLVVIEERRKMFYTGTGAN